MFTPEFVSDEQGEFVLVANHRLDNDGLVQMSVEYNRARIAFGKAHVPGHLKLCRVIYDIRGQLVSETSIGEVRQALEGVCNLEFMR
jgi:hypothetical protein